MRRKVTRRDFMKGAAIVAASGLLAGCSGGEGPAAPDNSEQPGTSEKPAESNSNSSSSSESESTSSSKPEETNGIKWIYSKNSDGTITLKGYDKCTSLNNVYFGGSKAKWDSILISTGMPSYDTYNGNKYLTTDIMNRYWNQTAASIGY